MSKFSFRRKDKMAFKHIAHGLIPAATIAPRPAVPRTPPPRSPYPSPERPRSALAAAILSSSLTGRTVAIPPARQRSLSASDCSHSASRLEMEPYTSTAEYTRDRWHRSVAGRPRLPSPEHSDPCDEDGDDSDDEDEEGVKGGLLSDLDEDHIYQSLERQGAALVTNDIYAVPHKQAGCQSETGGVTDSSVAEEVSAVHTRGKTAAQEQTFKKASSPVEPVTEKTMQSPDLSDDMSSDSPRGNAGSSLRKGPSQRMVARASHSEADEAHKELLEAQMQLVRALKEQNQVLAQRCEEQGQLLQQAHEHQRHLEKRLEQNQAWLLAIRDKGSTAGEQVQLCTLRQQNQQLVDENDGLKMTVHRLNAELSRYQAKFRPLSKEESSSISAMPKKGPAPPWLLDMKCLSPLLLAYEDQLNEKDSLLQSYVEETRRFRERVEEVVQENDSLHQQLSKAGGACQKNWRQLQDQAKLVLKENQLLMQQLEVQQTKAKESHNRHQQEVSKVTKEVMLLEAEKQSLQEELEKACSELQLLQTQHRKNLSALECAVSREEHAALVSKLHRQLEQEEEKRSSKLEELTSRVASLQEEKRTLLLEKSSLSAEMKNMETELEALRQANRKSQKKICLLKVQVEDSMDREMTAHQYLTSIVAAAEKTKHERDQLVHMASILEQDKQGVLTRVIEGTMRLGKLQEKVKVYKRQAAASLGVMGHRLQEQEDDFAGRAASYRGEIRHLQQLLRDKQEALDEVLQQKREMEGELETVWEATSKENQRIKEALFRSLSWAERLPTPAEATVLDFTEGLIPGRPSQSTVLPLAVSGQGRAKTLLQRSPMFESDSDHPHNHSSDEGEKNCLDFYS
ncbi:centrosomal protein of 89 kDa isoform X2 [Brienomyrus brachyistius]|uniref:centrosomal protein of 89 kDa isoform X2 n=1 Tax=Brienomyrus brachyistius TaxID=42636 RepID=UPI0020B1A4E8|nr:centrosomal protein of 89 kDa isoform X2 [Brienomyrus brachyistius]